MKKDSQRIRALRNGFAFYLVFSLAFAPAAQAFAQDSQDLPPSDAEATSQKSEGGLFSTAFSKSNGKSSTGSADSREPNYKGESSEQTAESDQEIALPDDEDGPPPESSMSMSGSGDVSGGADGSPNTIKQVIPDVDKTTGALSYTYPIKVPPGRNGVEPSLGLTYNSLSSDSDSAFGYGWSINIPSIKRVNKDGVGKLYAENYFESSLTGELVRVASSTTAFKSRVDNGEFLNYVFSGSSWTVTDKSGKTYTFGGGASSTRQTDPASSTKTFAWMLSEVRDLNGNYMTYEYASDKGQVYPEKISYTQYGTTTAPFEVEFTRETRPDVSLKFNMGFAATSTYRIKEITAKHNGTWIKKYALGYATSTTGVRSLLDTITESGLSEAAATTTLPATDFDYKGGLPTGVTDLFSEMGLTCPASVNTKEGVIIADVNGDGLPDLVQSTDSNTSTYINAGNYAGTRWVASSTFNSPLLIWNTNATTTKDLGVRMADINGDGKADVLRRTDITTSTAVYLATSSGWSLNTSTSTWNIPTEILSSTGGDFGTRIIDLNGDGLPDFFRRDGGVTQVWVNNGSDWVSDYGWASPVNSLSGTIWGDFNNDGLIDILQSYTDSGTWIRKTYLNNGNQGWSESSLFNPPTIFGTNDQGVREADVNGDGFSDLLASKYGSEQSVYINTGTGFATSTWSPSWHFIDNNGDTGYRLTDLNGDGLVDFINCNPVGTDYFKQNQAIKPDLVSQLKSPFGGLTKINYKSTVDFVTSSSTLLNPELPFAVSAVETVSKADGISPTSTQTFSYQGGKQYFASALDRKMAGFSKMTSTDSASNTTSYFFHQGDTSSTSTGEYDDQLSKIGKVYRTEGADSSGNIYSKSINKWDSFASGSSTLVNLIQSVSMAYDGDSDHKDKAESYTYSTSTGNLLTKIEWGEASSSDDGTFSDVGTDNFTTSYTYAVTTSTAPTSTVTIELHEMSLFDDANLVNYWRMENNSNDAKGSSHGTDHSMSYSTSSGKFNYGAHFAAGGYFNGSATQPTSAYSISGWLSHGSASNDNNEAIWDTQQNGSYSTGLTYVYNPSLGKFRLYHNNGSWVSSDDVGSSFEDGAVHHIMVTWDGSLIRFYMDGSVIGNSSYSTSITNWGGYQVGQRTTSDQPYLGNIDDLAIFSRALSLNEVFTLYAGSYLDPSNISFLASESTVNASSTKVRESRFYYDSLALGSATYGNPTKQESWKVSSSYVSSTKAYNSYGLVTSATDPRGKTSTYTYDTYNLYVSTSTNPLSQTTSYLYDYSLGKPKQVTDANGLVFQTVFDGVDRVTEEKQPDLASPSSLVTKSTTAYTDSYNASSILSTNYLDASTTVLSYTYLDGFGRTLQTRTEGEDSYIAADTVYNNLERVDKQSLPYFSSGTSKTSATSTADLYTNYSYDALNRVSKTVTSIGTTTMAFDDWKTTVTDPLGIPKSLYKDAYGNLSRVDETLATSTYTTTYTYNYLQNLTGITDALGNVRSFTYDGLGRRLTAQDLHASGDGTYGSYTYTYDDGGNLTQQVDPNAQTVNFTYDDLSRPLTEDYTGASSTEVTYTYDSCTYGVGKLCTASSTDVLESSSYNALGAVSTSTKTISGTGYTTVQTYDRLGNVLETINPDSSKVKNTYNAAGLLETIQRKESTDGGYTDVVTDFDYGPHGKVTEIYYENAAVTTNVYDAAKQYRLTRKFTVLPYQEEGFAAQQSFMEQEPLQPSAPDFVITPDMVSTSSTSTSEYEYKSQTSGAPEKTESTSETESTSTGTEETTSNATSATSATDSSSSSQDSTASQESETDPSFATSESTPTSSESGSTSSEAASNGAGDATTTSTQSDESTESSATTTQESSGEAAGWFRSFFADIYQGIASVVSRAKQFVVAQFKVFVAFASGELELYDTPLYTDESGISYYRLEGTSTDAWAHNNGADTNTSYSTSTGKFNKGLSLQSIGGSRFNTTSSMPSSGSMTVTAWIKPIDNGSSGTSPDTDFDGVIFFGFHPYFRAGFKAGSTRTLRIDTKSGTVTPGYGSDNTWYITDSTTTISTSTWTHVAFVHDDSASGTDAIYINGELNRLATTFKGGFTVYDDASLYPNGAGARYYNTSGAPFSNLWNGNIDDLAAFSRALSAEEISSLYTGSWTGSSEGECIQDLNYTYDANGNITRITDVSDTQTYKFVDYTYDDLNRLVTASSTSAATGTNYFHQYTYDAIGNITSLTPAGAYGYTTTTTGYVNPHAAINIGGVAYAYDTNGNLTSDGTWTHTWDYRNRLARSSSTSAVTYIYDSNNSRVKLTSASTTNIVPFSGYSTENGTAVKYINANGQLIATIRGTTSTAAVYYTHPDHLGSADKTTDQSAVVELSDYLPFGAVRYTAGSINDRKGYINQDFDESTSLSYLNARYYKNSVGRFMSQDPVFWGRQNLLNPQSLNSYSYANNNPIKLKDPTGKSAFGDAFNAIVGAIKSFFGFSGGGTSNPGANTNAAVGFPQQLERSSATANYNFAAGQRSTTRDKSTNDMINQLDPRVQQPAINLINNAESELGARLIVVPRTGGYRSIEEQNAIWQQSQRNLAPGGNGKWLTNAQGGSSYHNYGLAMDLAFTDQNGQYDSTRTITEDIGKIGEAQGFEWGGRWTGKAYDAAHFQMTFGQTTDQLYNEYLNSR